MLCLCFKCFEVFDILFFQAFFSFDLIGGNRIPLCLGLLTFQVPYGLMGLYQIQNKVRRVKQ